MERRDFCLFFWRMDSEKHFGGEDGQALLHFIFTFSIKPKVLFIGRAFDEKNGYRMAAVLKSVVFLEGSSERSFWRVFGEELEVSSLRVSL